MLKKPKQNKGIAPPMLRKLTSTSYSCISATYVTVGLSVAAPSIKAQKQMTAITTYLRALDQFNGSLGSDVGAGTKTMSPLPA